MAWGTLGLYDPRTVTCNTDAAPLQDQGLLQARLRQTLRALLVRACRAASEQLKDWISVLRLVFGFGECN